MARAGKLKVFRTAIGFHDAYVAAPSRKAALAAWGTTKDLFARGQADIVTDEALSAAPLAAPGTVVKLLRGTVAEQVAALPAGKGTVAKQSAGKAPAKARTAAPPRPRPSRNAIDAAEGAVAVASAAQGEQMRQLDERERALREERQALARTQREEMKRLEQARDDAERDYGRALARWQAEEGRR